MSTVNLLCRSSVWTAQKNPSSCFWGKTGYCALKNGTNDVDYTYLYFPLPFNKGVIVTSATLTIKTRALAAMTNRTITVEALSGGMNFSTVTWAHGQAGVNTKDAVTVTKSGALAVNTAWTFNVGKMLQDFSDGQLYAGFRIRTNDPNLVLVQGHGMGPSLAPSLSVTWSDAPLPPDVLSPSSGNIVGEAAPVLRFNFADFSGDRSMSSCQVTLGTTNTASDWDSGEIQTNVPQLDLSTTSWKPPAEGTVVYWKVRVKDGSGLWSAWSSITSWAYHPLPTLTLVNPDATGTITDPTPPIDWTYKGGTPQTAYWIIIDRQTNSGWSRVVTTHQVPGNATEWTSTVPLGANGIYRVRVCAWDSYVREATPGFETFATVEQIFQFKAGSAVVPNNGAFSETFPYPGIRISWHSPTEPDRWVIHCDGEPLADYTGDVLSLGGDSYGLTDRLVAPRKPHTYQVYAIQNGKASAPLTIVGKTNPVGTWIISLDNKQRLCIVNDRDRETTFTEDTGTYNVVGAHSTIVVNKSLRGYEGTLKGLLRQVPQVPGMDSLAWKNLALDIKANVGARYWVVWGDELFQAVLSDVQVARSTAIPDSYDFSCKFYQQSDFDFEE